MFPILEVAARDFGNFIRGDFQSAEKTPKRYSDSYTYVFHTLDDTIVQVTVGWSSDDDPWIAVDSAFENKAFARRISFSVTDGENEILRHLKGIRIQLKKWMIANGDTSAIG
jgi:hypothetical protein